MFHIRSLGDERSSLCLGCISEAPVNQGEPDTHYGGE
jgi:hypothetical protein